MYHIDCMVVNRPSVSLYMLYWCSVTPWRWSRWINTC